MIKSMHRLKFWVLFFGLAMGLSSCAIFSKAREENLREVQIGQTKEEVVAVIGEPSEKSDPGGSERWFYDITSADQKSSYPYTAVFEKDKLMAWYFDNARVSTRGGHGKGSGGP